MAGPRNRFTNPVNGAFYDWAINHREEEAFGKTRNIERTAPTGNTGLVKQQGDDGPLLIKVKGTALRKSQVEQFIDWFKLTGSQTIHFKDFTGDEYEVVINSFLPQRLYTSGNMNDPANAPYHYYAYDMEMEVITIISGIWEGVTP